jgi:hypothetical protein
LVLGEKQLIFLIYLIVLKLMIVILAWECSEDAVKKNGDGDETRSAQVVFKKCAFYLETEGTIAGDVNEIS